MADLESVELTCYTTLVNLTALPATCARSSRLQLQGASRFVPLKPDPKRRLNAAAIPSDERRRVPSSSSRTASRFPCGALDSDPSERGTFDRNWRLLSRSIVMET